VHRGNARVVERGEQSGLALKPRRTLRIGHELQASRRSGKACQPVGPPGDAAREQLTDP
jgi:hypothetical protein